MQNFTIKYLQTESKNTYKDYPSWPETDGQVLLLKTVLAISLNTEIEVVPDEPSPPLPSVHGTGRYSAHYQWRKVIINPAINHATYNGDLPVR